MAKIIDSAGSITGCREYLHMDSRLPNNPMLIWGDGNPEGSISAMIGTIYIDMTSTPDKLFYIKGSGYVTKTGWRRVQTVAV